MKKTDELADKLENYIKVAAERGVDEGMESITKIIGLLRAGKVTEDDHRVADSLRVMGLFETLMNKDGSMVGPKAEALEALVQEGKKLLELATKGEEWDTVEKVANQMKHLDKARLRLLLHKLTKTEEPTKEEWPDVVHPN